MARLIDAESDLIERSEVLKQLRLNHKDVVYIDKKECARRIKAIPSARPRGEWIEDPINKNIMHCSNCKVSYTKDFLRGMSLYHEPKDTPDFCPNCGSDNREREGE